MSDNVKAPWSCAISGTVRIGGDYKSKETISEFHCFICRILGEDKDKVQSVELIYDKENYIIASIKYRKPTYAELKDRDNYIMESIGG